MQSSVVENGVKARYIGQNVGARLIKGNDDRVYRGGNNRLDRFQFIHPDDVELLKDSFAVVESAKVEMIVQNADHISTFNAERFNVTEGASDGQAESKPSRKRGD